MTWDKWSKMLLESNGADTWTTSTMGNGKCLMEVQMTNICSNKTWGSETELSVHVCTVHVNLSSILMNSIANTLDILLEYTVSRWVSDHDTRESISVLLCFLLNFFKHDVSLGITVDWDNFHSTDLGGSWIGSVSGGWAKADVSLEVTSTLVVLLNGHESSVLTCGSTVWLGRDSIVLSDANQVVFNLINELLVSLALIEWGVWMKICETMESDWDHSNS